MATNTDFLKFSAYSIKDLITRKLAQDSNFTDQIYEGSNLAILIDIFSYMAQCMLYNLNNAAAESMFSDTQIYENMNRLIKFIGYHPSGCKTSIAEITVNNSNSVFNGVKIPKYSYIDTELYDNISGKKIYYSTIDTQIISMNENFSCLFYNGKWNKHDSIYTSSGDAYQTFVLEGLMSDFDNARFIPENGIHVYIYHNDTFYFYECVNQGLFANNTTNSTHLYQSTDQICDLRLNENKTYEITFGNGINGKIPPKDSKIYIFYLESNGPNGKIQQLDIRNLSIKKNTLNLTNDQFNNLIGFNINEEEKQLANTKWTNYISSTDFIQEENVNDIRRNAPEYFKTGNRLVTADDYTYFFKLKNNELVIDVICENNWQYISNFYKWLYELSFNGNFVKYKKRENTNSNYYINQYKLSKYDLKWSNACSQNNVYLWIKMKNNLDLCKQLFNQQISHIKTLTHDVVYLEPLTVYFKPCAEPIENIINNLDNIFDFETTIKKNNTYIEITLDENSIYSTHEIKIKIQQIFKDFFDANNQTLNALIDFNIIMNKIYELKSIINVRTITKSLNGLTYIQPGLCFASWTADVIDPGDDLNISNISKQLNSFQFPKLYDEENINDMILVVRHTQNNIQYNI